MTVGTIPMKPQVREGNVLSISVIQANFAVMMAVALDP